MCVVVSDRITSSVSALLASSLYRHVYRYVCEHAQLAAIARGRHILVTSGRGARSGGWVHVAKYGSYVQAVSI